MCFVLYILHKSISHRNKNTTLNKKRKGILDEVHLKEKQLSRIDYLRYEMDWENKE